MITAENIRNAIANKDIYLEYQPIFNLQTNAIVAYEALARWQFKGEFISPIVFMRFDNIELARELTQYVLNIAEKTEAKIKIPIHVNISSHDICNHIQAKVSCLEITEEASKKKEKDCINRLSQRYKIIIDDFGQEYASWLQIPYFNIDTIKLDKEVASELISTHTEWYQEVIEFIVKMSKKYNVQIIAEGIETKEQLSILKGLGIDKGQGYLLAYPGKIYY